MGQFKPMVKMMTTEPSVILKLKKGGHASTKKMKAEDNGTGHKKMADGGVPMMVEGAPMIKRPAPMAVAKVPARPSMAMRRKAMAVKPALVAAAPAMKKGGKAEKHDDAAQDRAMIKKALAGKKFATGGVVNGQGGFKDGGIIKSTKGETKVDTTKPDRSPAKTGGVKLGNAGGYATGGVAKANGGGYKKGGAAKKYADGGNVQDAGRAVKMPQGNKRPSTPVSINQLSGTFKKGGKVKKYADGGDSQLNQNQDAYKQWESDERKFNEGLRSDVEDALTYPLRKGKELFDKVKGSKFVKDMSDAAEDYGDVWMKGAGLRSQNAPSPRSVTKTKESVTVAKKRGGSC